MSGLLKNILGYHAELFGWHGNSRRMASAECHSQQLLRIKLADCFDDLLVVKDDVEEGVADFQAT